MDYQWLQTQFALNPNKSKAGLAKALGLEPPAVSKILKGNRQIKAPEYAIMRRYFGLPVDGERAASPQNMIEPLSGNQQSLHLQEHEKDRHDQGWLIPENILSQNTQTTPENLKTFIVKERVMEPDFKYGEAVLVDLSNNFPSPPGAYIIYDGYSHLVRQCELLQGSAPVEIRISARDKAFMPQTISLEECQIIGRVVAKLQWL